MKHPLNFLAASSGASRFPLDTTPATLCTARKLSDTPRLGKQAKYTRREISDLNSGPCARTVSERLPCFPHANQVLRPSPHHFAPHDPLGLLRNAPRHPCSMDIFGHLFDGSSPYDRPIRGLEKRSSNPTNPERASFQEKSVASPDTATGKARRSGIRLAFGKGPGPRFTGSCRRDSWGRNPDR